MLDIPTELLLAISAHMDHGDLQALAVTSRSLCNLLLPEYLRVRGLKLRSACSGGTRIQLSELGGFAALGLWSTVPMFHPPEEIYCSIPYGAHEARSSIRFITRFLLDPSNTSNLRNFHLSIWCSDPLPIMPELIKIHGLFCALPLTQLGFSGFGSAAFLPPSINLRSGASHGSHTLTSLYVSSDHAFAPDLVRATMGILKHSPIKRLSIYTVSLSPSQWSTLLGQLSMAFLEDVEVEGDIPQPALIRFLIKHRGLRAIHVRGNVLPGRAQPNRSQGQDILPNLRTLHAPLATCCDVVGQASDPSSLHELHVEMSCLDPHNPLFLHLMDALQRFQMLGYLGLQLAPSSLNAASQTSSHGHGWGEHPACKLRQVRTLTFYRSQGLLSLGDIVCPHFLSFAFFTYRRNRTRCAPTYGRFQCQKRFMRRRKGWQTEWNSLGLCARQTPPSDL